jgi:hypothetical protein
MGRTRYAAPTFGEKQKDVKIMTVAPLIKVKDSVELGFSGAGRAIGTPPRQIIADYLSEYFNFEAENRRLFGVTLEQALVQIFRRLDPVQLAQSELNLKLTAEPKFVRLEFSLLVAGYNRLFYLHFPQDSVLKAVPKPKVLRQPPLLEPNSVEVISQIIGDYSLPEDYCRDYLMLKLVPHSRQLTWGSCGLVANLLTDYFSPLFEPLALSRAARRDLVGSLGYVSNELIENAVKFHCSAALPINIVAKLYGQSLVVLVTNFVNEEAGRHFKAGLNELRQSDPADLLLARMERNALNPDKTASGLGILTIMQDYQTTLGWKFEAMPSLNDLTRVTTIARIPLSVNEG